MQEYSFFSKLNNWAKKSISLKIIVIGFIALLLMIPSSMIQSLITERQATRDVAVSDIWKTWGKNQIVAGPTLSVPVVISTINNQKEVEKSLHYLHFLPDKIEMQGIVKPSIRYRSIYEAVLYEANLEIKGSFNPLNYSGLNIDPSAIEWDKARITFGITDMKGVRDNIEIAWNNSIYRFIPGLPEHDIFNTGVSVPLIINPDSSAAFTLRMRLNGSRLLAFMPLASETKVEIKSNWADPSFEGAFIPEHKEITKNGFIANWKILELNRNYGSFGLDNFIWGGDEDQRIVDYDGRITSENEVGAFGVNLILPVDEYQRVTRAAKYAILFILLTFATFFFFELLKKKYVHPIQYLIIGFAIILFYILLLSLGEYMLFKWAYLISSGAITIMVMLYAAAIFADKKFGIVVGAILLSLYIYFYILLQMQYYSLLFGSVGLMIILSITMILTRKLHQARNSDVQENSEL